MVSMLVMPRMPPVMAMLALPSTFTALRRAAAFSGVSVAGVASRPSRYRAVGGLTR